VDAAAPSSLELGVLVEPLRSESLYTSETPLKSPAIAFRQERFNFNNLEAS
jgi:hypothetical protein